MFAIMIIVFSDVVIRDRLESSDRLAELTTLARVPDTDLQRAAHQADLTRHDAGALPPHRRLEDLTTLSNGPEHCRVGDEAAVQDDVGHRGGPQSKLLGRVLDTVEPRPLARALEDDVEPELVLEFKRLLVLEPRELDEAYGGAALYLDAPSVTVGLR